ncbi:hypothetical protein SHKM778_49660 [Streptomyces sp. KM77-8]|uniref:Uncharacterized protein n=1 Tax=Streptomyces haneummycinicus TaxID=3074435 RepID=A0AAT9HN73_9ACTN
MLGHHVDGRRQPVDRTGDRASGASFVDFGDVLLRERPDGVHWKTGPLVEYAGGRAFAWVDDEQGEPDRAYVSAHHRGPALLHHVDPRVGLREDDFRTLAGFGRSPGAPRATGVRG